MHLDLHGYGCTLWVEDMKQIDQSKVKFHLVRLDQETYFKYDDLVLKNH